MKEILIACGDVDLLRKLITDLPPDTFKPIATKRGAGVAAKLAGRALALAIVHAQLEDGSAPQLLTELKQLHPQLPVLLLTAGKPPTSGPFESALRYPVPGPVFRNAIKRLTEQDGDEQDLEKWRLFYREVKARLERVPGQNYFQILGVADGAPHHVLVKAYDALSMRYHPDRYNQHRQEKWGAALYDKVNALYKVITEAYSVLSDRRLRASYEQALARGELRLSPEETATADKGPRSLEDLSKNPASRKFLKLAQTELAKGDLQSALQNLNFAHSMEPDNGAITAKIDEIKGQLGR